VLDSSGAAVERAVRVSSVARGQGGSGWALRGTRGRNALHDTPSLEAAGATDAPLGTFDLVLLTDASSSLGGWHRASANIALVEHIAPAPAAAVEASVAAETAAAGAFVAGESLGPDVLDRVRERVRLPLSQLQFTLPFTLQFTLPSHFPTHSHT
jgi:hypothetical protein